MELWIYGENQYKIYALSECENERQKIVLNKEGYLTIEYKNGKYYFAKEQDGALRRINRKVLDVSEMEPEDVWEYEIKENRKFALLVLEKKKQLQSYEYYLLKEKTEWKIGSDLQNDIRYDVSGMVSGMHGKIKRDKNGWCIEDYSRNGIYKNGKRIKKRERLKMGDSFSIFGLHFVFLGEMVAIGCRNRERLAVGLPLAKQEDSLENYAMAIRYEKFLHQLQRIRRKQEKRVSEFVPFVAKMENECKNIVQNWGKNCCKEGIYAFIGMDEREKYCEINLQEWADGPHGMIVGMTGSGKSQCLQAIVLSLVLRYNPAQLQLVLIDYKGGGMAEQFSTFPHVAGVLTNLDKKMLSRGICALKSEIQRREHLFSEKRVDHINVYNAGNPENPISHLCVIVDEFAELKQHVPIFAETILQLSRVGRSLGIHVVLTTQKVGGEMEQTLLANSGFRICFRMQDSVHCEYIMGEKLLWGHKPVGRGYLLKGNVEKSIEFQGAYTGSKEEGFPKERNVSEEQRNEKFEKQNQRNAISFVLDQVKKAMREGIYKEAKKLWLPLLPTLVRPEMVLDTEKNVVMGLCDEPGKQRQSILKLDVKTSGNIVLAGENKSGKTSFITAFILQQIKLLDSENCWIYFVDFEEEISNKFLDIPHVGGIAHSEEELKRCIAFLEIELNKRKQEEKKSPLLLVVIEHMERLRKETDEIVLERIYSLLREGNRYNLYMILTANGFGPRDIPSAWKNDLPKKIALFQNTSDRDAFFGEHVMLEETEKIPGRGVVKKDGEYVSFQTVFYAETEIEKLQFPHVVGAKKLQIIPKKLSYEEFQEYARKEGWKKEKKEVCFGIKVKDGELAFGQAEDLHAFLILGKENSRRLEMMRFLLLQALERKEKVYCFGEKMPTLNRQDVEKFSLCQTKEQLQECFFHILGDKRESCVDNCLTDVVPLWIFIDDLKHFLEMCRGGWKQAMDLEELLDKVLQSKAGRKIIWIASCDSGEVREMRKYRMFRIFSKQKNGIYVGSDVGEQNYFPFPFIEPTEREQLQYAGNGMLSWKGMYERIRIPVEKSNE